MTWPGGVRRRSRTRRPDRARCAGWTFSSFRNHRPAGSGGWYVCRDYYSKYEYPFHVSPTTNKHDAVEAIEIALAAYEKLFGHPLVDRPQVNAETGELPVSTIVTDNGGPFRSFTFEAFIELHPELRHVRTKVRSPRQNGSRERGFGTLKYERLYIDEITDAVMLAERAEDYRLEYNHVRTPRSDRLEPATGGAPGPGRPHHPHIRNRRKPANYLTRDTLTGWGGPSSGRRGPVGGEFAAGLGQTGRAPPAAPAAVGRVGVCCSVSPLR